jgi:hypothetical protein
MKHSKVTQNSFYTADNLIVLFLNFIVTPQQNNSSVCLSGFLMLFKLTFSFFRSVRLDGKLFTMLMPVQYSTVQYSTVQYSTVPTLSLSNKQPNYIELPKFFIHQLMHK